jgi:hypothetical protein
MAVVGVLLLAACSGTSGSVPAPPDRTPASAAATPAHTAKPPQTLLDLTGSGAKETQIFTAGGSWDLTWSDHDASGLGDEFSVAAYNADTNQVVLVPVQVSLPAGATKNDVSHMHEPGRYYLSVNGTGDWHITVTG